MKSHRQEFKDRIKAAVEQAHTDWDAGAEMLLQVIHEQQNGGSRRACGCRLSCDGFTTIVWWPCRQHWWAEFGGPVGGTLMMVGLCFVIAAIFIALGLTL